MAVLTRMRPGFQRLLWISALAASLANPAAGQLIPSALPAAARPLDIRDSRTITAPKGKLVATASHVFSVATEFFGADGARRDLPLDQTIRLQLTPILLTYGLSDRASVGAGLSLAASFERKLSVLNFVQGATILGQPLAAADVTALEIQGDGVGDLNLLAQYSPDWFGDRIRTLLALDVVAPTAGSTPAGMLYAPIGQGYWTYRFSIAAASEVFPLTTFARAAFEINRSETLTNAAGNPTALDPGNGAQLNVGTSYAIGDSFQLNGLIALGWKDESLSSDQPAALPFVRSLEFRPGYTWSRGSLLFTQALSIPLAGRNVLAAEGILTTLEYRF